MLQSRNLGAKSRHFRPQGREDDTVEIVCNWSDRATNTPALYSAWSGDTAYLLTNATQETMPAALCKVTLTYTASATSTPPTTYSEQTSQVEVPIQQHPNFADWADDWDSVAEAFKPGSSKFGISTFIKGTSTVT